MIDVAITLSALLFAVGGYRNGAIVATFSCVGVILGLMSGAVLAQPISSHLASGQGQVPIAISCVILLALFGQASAVYVGRLLRSHIKHRHLRRVDSTFGGFLGVASVLIVSWFVAVPLASAPYPALASQVRQSAIVRNIAGIMPSGADGVYSSLRNYLNRSGFPPVLGELQATDIVNVPAPDPNLLSSTAALRVQASVVKVYGAARSCKRQIEGSGFVFAPHRIVTNAHVVAGTSQTSVITTEGELSAKVVLYDAQRDIAVLSVPDLVAPVMQMATEVAATNANAIVVGYPEDGPYDVRAARVRAQETLLGHDIYGNGEITRDIYSIRGLVRSGNSGGPLITADGKVLGIVFATALDSTDTGFVLTDKEIAGDLATGIATSGSVGTGPCTD